MAELTDRDRAILDFEATPWRNQGAKEQAIREAFDVSAVRYYMVLNQLSRDPAALDYAPGVCARVRRVIEQRWQQRSGSAA